MFYERVKALCEAENIKITPFVQKIGLSKGNVEKWRCGKLPNAEILMKIADYFHTSVDFLLGREGAVKTDTDHLTEDERALLESYRSINKQGKEYIRETMEMVCNKYKKAINSPDMEIAGEMT